MNTRVRFPTSFVAALLVLAAGFPNANLRADLDHCKNLVEHVPVPAFVSGKKILPLPKADAEKAAYEVFLRDRYGFKTGSVRWGKKYPMVIHGGDESTFVGKADYANAEVDPVEYDAVVIGGGPAGITAGIYLTDAGKKILFLEKEPVLGGLAIGGQSAGGVRYGRGAAYFTSMEGEIYQAYKHMGFGQYKQKFTIHGAIDSYYWNGKFYEGLWESPEALAELPASFTLFKHYLHHADDIGLIPNQPFEDAENLILDTLTMAEWVRTFPEEVRKLAATDPEAKKIYARFLADPKVNRADPMGDVLGLLNLYGRSALGNHTDKISAASFANFYISELDVRYTGNLGTGSTMESALKKLKQRSGLVNLKTSAPLAKIRTTDAGVEVYYVQNGVTHFAKAKDAVYSAQLSTGLTTIEDYEKLAPAHYRTVREMKYSHYLVVNAHVEGHPWTKTYDTWVRKDEGYSQNDITDIIDGRWQDFRGEELPRTDNRGILTVYFPLPANTNAHAVNDARLLELSESALDQMRASIEPLIDGKPVKIIAGEANRWLSSVLITEPGHFRTQAKILKQPIGNIHFANNNLGTPSIEEGVYRALKAVQKILAKQGVTPLAPKKPRKPKKSAYFFYAPVMDRAA